jgi:hypothetical protein
MGWPGNIQYPFVPATGADLFEKLNCRSEKDLKKTASTDVDY